jgi:hypothetical protein
MRQKRPKLGVEERLRSGSRQARELVEWVEQYAKFTDEPVRWWIPNSVHDTKYDLWIAKLYIYMTRVREIENALSKSSPESSAASPPGLLIDLLMPPDRAEDVLYNIQGRFGYWCEKHGRRRARLIFLSQSLIAVCCFWIDWTLQRLKLLRRHRRS